MSQNYKKIALEFFRKKDYENAKIFISLAYEQKPSAALLNLIELCDFAAKFPNEGDLLFEFYTQNCKVRSFDSEFERVLAMSESKRALPPHFETALSYTDFLESEQQLGFQRSFENVIFANRLVISNKNDFLNFLEKLLDHGYIDTTLAYVESVASVLAGDEKFMQLQKKLQGKVCENRA